MCMCIYQLKADDLLKISQTTLEDILLCEAKAGLHSAAPVSVPPHTSTPGLVADASAQSFQLSRDTFPYSDLSHNQATLHQPSISASPSTLSAHKRRGGNTGGVHSPHAHQTTQSSGKIKRRRTSHSMEGVSNMRGKDDMEMGDGDDEGMERGGDRDSNRGARNRNRIQGQEQGYGQDNDNDDEDEEEEGEGEGGGYDQSSADGSPDRYFSQGQGALLPLGVSLSKVNTDRDRDDGRNGENADDLSSLSRLMHNTATAAASATSQDSANSNGIPFGARNGDTTHLTADSGSSADRPYGGQGLGVEGNQLEYLEESFQLIALMVRGNAARIKDDMK